MDKHIMLYHGTSKRDFEPRFGGGCDYHDYGNGFYTTESLDAAKEWACQNRYDAAFVYAYKLDTNSLKLLDLDENNTLAWVSVLMAHRRFRNRYDYTGNFKEVNCCR